MKLGKCVTFSVINVRKYVESVAASTWIKSKLRPDLQCPPMVCNRECRYIIKFSSCDECICSRAVLNQVSEETQTEAAFATLTTTVSDGIFSKESSSVTDTTLKSTETYPVSSSGYNQIQSWLPAQQTQPPLNFETSAPITRLVTENDSSLQSSVSLLKNKPQFLGITLSAEPVTMKTLFAATLSGAGADSPEFSTSRIKQFSQTVKSTTDDDQLLLNQKVKVMKCPKIFCPSPNCITITNANGCHECACDDKFWRSMKKSSPKTCLNEREDTEFVCDNNCVIVTKLDGCTDCACPTTLIVANTLSFASRNVSFTTVSNGNLA